MTASRRTTWSSVGSDRRWSISQSLAGFNREMAAGLEIAATRNKQQVFVCGHRALNLLDTTISLAFLKFPEVSTVESVRILGIPVFTSLLLDGFLMYFKLST